MPAGTRAIVASGLLAAVVAANASAQEGLRSASLPERPVATAPASPASDVFLAGPETYRPRRDREGRDRSPYLVPGAFGSGASLYGFSDDRAITVNVRILPPERPASAVVPPAPEVRPSPAVNPPGPAKTFYVIPGCYAGDKHPRQTPLSLRCDVSRLRVIPPTVNAVRVR